jgi:hypothetical protein
MDLSERHPSTRQVAQWFTYEHLQEPARSASMRCAHLAERMLADLPDSPELTAGLRKLLEAKDCFVRATIEANL